MRLTNEHRRKIVARAVAKAFDKRNEVMDKAEAALALKAYNSLFDSDLRRKVNAVPENWLRHCECLQFNVLGRYHTLNARKNMPTPSTNYCSNLGTLTGEIAEEVEAHHNSRQDLVKERNQTEIKLSAMLDNISTFKKLTELWPEGGEFYADLDEDGQVKGGLPAIRFDDINSVLGIKKKAA